MKIHFKMLINDGEKYYISDNPGIALCDYVYMRGLESIDDNRFWEEQLAHYQAHKAFNFDLDLVASSSIANISNAIAERIGFDKLEFEYYDFMSDYRSPWVFNKILQKP